MVIASALLDRLLHHAIVFHIEGSSYRLRRHADLLQAESLKSVRRKLAEGGDAHSPFKQPRKEV